MAHHEHFDELANPAMTIKELRGVIRRQRAVIAICLLMIVVLSMYLRTM